MPSKSPSVTPEEAVRGYLAYLRDPSKFKADDSAAVKVRERIAALLDKRDALDPIEYLNKRVELDAELKEASDTADPGVQLRADFVANIGAYLQSSGVNIDMLKELMSGDRAKVRELNAALKDAGAGGKIAMPSSPSGTGGVRAPRLTLEEKQAAVPAKGTFKLVDYAATIDRNPATANNYLKELVETGFVKEMGEDETSTSPRKPKLYQKA